MLLSYLPILIFILVGIFSGILFIILGYILGPRRPSKAKLDVYECGFHAFDDARMKFEVKYYLVGILFILFDLEVAFIFPWAVSFVEFGLYGFFTIFIFLFILTLGFVYEWKKGALEWE